MAMSKLSQHTPQRKVLNNLDRPYGEKVGSSYPSTWETSTSVSMAPYGTTPRPGTYRLVVSR